MAWIFFNSPDALRLAYISPFDFETLGEVFIYNIVSDSAQKIVTVKDLPETKAPHKLAWLDDRNLLIVIHYAYGTIATSGSLYVYNFEKKGLLRIVELDKTQNIQKITVANDTVTLEIATYDKNLMNFTLDSKVYKTEEIDNLIRQWQSST